MDAGTAAKTVPGKAPAPEVAAAKTTGVTAATKVTTAPALRPQRHGQDQRKRRNGHPTAHTKAIISGHRKTPVPKIFRCCLID